MAFPMFRMGNIWDDRMDGNEYYAYNNKDETKYSCDCGAYNSPKLDSWSEIILENRNILLGALTIIMLLLCIILACSIISSYSSNEQKKSLSCEDLIADPNFKVDDDDVKSTLSSIVTKY